MRHMVIFACQSNADLRPLLLFFSLFLSFFLRNLFRRVFCSGFFVTLPSSFHTRVVWNTLKLAISPCIIVRDLGCLAKRCSAVVFPSPTESEIGAPGMRAGS